MRGEWRRGVAAASLLTMILGAPAALAQAVRPWVDPPTEAGAAPPSQRAPDEVKAPAPPPAPAPSEVVTYPDPAAAQDDGVVSGEDTDLQAAPPAQSKSVQSKIRPKAAAPTETRVRKVTARTSAPTREIQKRARTASRSREVAASRAEPPRAERRRLAERSNSARRFMAIRAAAASSGLEVMHLQTIEFPDGRRINVLVRP